LEFFLHISQPTHPRAKTFQNIIDLRIGRQLIAALVSLTTSPLLLSSLVLCKVTLSPKHNLL